MFSSRFLAISLIIGIGAHPVEVEDRHITLGGWRKVSRPVHSAEHEVVFATRQQNLDKLESLLLAVSTPGNPMYGKHLTFEEVGEIINTKAASDKIIEWIRSNINGSQIIRQTPRGEYVRVRAPVVAFEEALQTEFHHWHSPISGMSALRCAKYNLPAELSSHVDAIFGTVEFPVAMESHSPKVTGPAENLITPDVMTSFYNIDSHTGSADVSQAVFATIGQTYSPKDLTAFQSKFGLPVETVAKDIGAHADSSVCDSNPNACGEANLDVQWMMAVSQGTPTTYFYETNEDAPFLAFLEAVANEPSPSLVNSISYGGPEKMLPQQTMKSFNTEAMKLGAIGASVFVSSGDDGAPGTIKAASECTYGPSYPATSPYVTSVGATFATSWKTSGQGEVVQQSNVGQASITSGGGFSTVFDAPDYQKDAVSGYFQNVGTQPVSGYATGGRGYPDVSLTGFGFEIMIGGKIEVVCGTSASTPSVAGMFSLVNAVRKEAGKSPVGFANPAIYQKHSTFMNDVTDGENQCGAQRSEDGPICCDQGFHAAQGWDPATGFGSVDFTKLKAAFTSDISPEEVTAAEQRLRAKVQLSSREVIV